MHSFNVWTWTVVLLLSMNFIFETSCDPVEGSRLLEEAFRDYDKRIRPNYGGLPVTVNVSLHIISLSKVNPTDMTFTMTFYIRQIWTDPRLSFNSRRNIDTITVFLVLVISHFRKYNILDASTSERIWLPDTFFVNEVSSVNHDILLKNQFCRISQDGLALFSKRVTLTMFSPMSSDMFPYDSHKLKLELESYGSQMKDLKYEWAPEAISSSAYNAPGFRVYELSAEDSSQTTSTGSYSRLLIEIDVKRNPLPYELGLMLSTLILSIFCLCTTSHRVNPTQGTYTAFLLVSFITALYGILALNGSIGVVTCMSVLQFHVLLNGGFSLICLIVNIRRNSGSLESALQQNSKDASEDRTETATENHRSDELQIDVGAPLENKQCSEENEEKVWGKVIHNMQKCRSTVGMDGGARWSLWIILLLMNAIFIILFRLIH